MHSGYLRHVAHTENEVNELGDEAETCTQADRRARRLKHENEKGDPEHYLSVFLSLPVGCNSNFLSVIFSADFMDDEYIEELLTWGHPHIVANMKSFEYSEKENAEILRLPRKECM
jgi:protein SHQ1